MADTVRRRSRAPVSRGLPRSAVRAEKSAQPISPRGCSKAIIEPGDRVTIEGDNQKQADFLASALAKVDPARVHDLHMVQSVAEIELAKAA